MAWRLSKSLLKGEIDNRIKGRVRGGLWLIGREQPLILELKGNCRRDIAGTLFTFTNPHPSRVDRDLDLAADQTGSTGDITASRKVRVFQEPVEEAYEMRKLGLKPAESLANALYLEWYSDRNGRVLIESADFQITVSGYAWRMTAEEDRRQAEANAQGARLWMDRLAEAVDAGSPGDPEPEHETGDKKPLDEFGWERLLKDSDAKTDKLMRLEEQFADLPPDERERKIAKEMGWNHIVDFLDAKARGEIPEDEDAFDDCEDEVPPDPAREGIDWVRDEQGCPVHPLYKKSLEIHLRMHHDCREAGWLKDQGDTPLQQMLFCGHMISSKIAGALNSLWNERQPDPGFIVAYLKRGLTYYNETLLHLKKVQESGVADAGRLQRYRDDLFSVREDMLRLMNEYRGKF